MRRHGAQALQGQGGQAQAREGSQELPQEAAVAGLPDSGDPHALQRFVEAQEAHGTYRAALAELEAGRKTTHWMWFVFPQLTGLGRSAMAEKYAISGLTEARAYAAHPVLGARLAACAAALLGVEGRSAREILGGTDEAKLRSSMTLFMRVAPDQPVFRQVLERYFDGVPDPETERRLEAA